MLTTKPLLRILNPSSMRIHRVAATGCFVGLLVKGHDSGYCTHEKQNHPDHAKQIRS